MNQMRKHLCNFQTMWLFQDQMKLMISIVLQVLWTWHSRGSRVRAPVWGPDTALRRMRRRREPLVTGLVVEYAEDHFTYLNKSNLCKKINKRLINYVNLKCLLVPYQWNTGGDYRVTLWSPYWDDVLRARFGSLLWRSSSQHDLAAKLCQSHNLVIWSLILQLFHRNDHHIEMTCCKQIWVDTLKVKVTAWPFSKIVFGL